jgi:CoA-substrate-specific enzyme activase, putative
LSDENAVFPEYGLYAVAMGTAMYAEGLSKEFYLKDIIDALNRPALHSDVRMETPLFKNQAEYEEFKSRHDKDNVGMGDLSSYHGPAYLGVDCGSTTTKLLLMSDDYKILYQYYSANEGNPVEIVRKQLLEIYDQMPDSVTIAGAVVTGYGEDLIKNAFSFDAGEVETMAHFKAARHFNPNVDFIMDIGGQDIKCFKIKNNAIDSIMLNEACSSGCGSFIETFAHSMGYQTKEFAHFAIDAKEPVDLGSRCTVFMNSSVKQAQKDGANVQDISAGLSMSVIKNVLYKVIRLKNSAELGENVVVQGGTFLNDAILRSFELETGKNVIRPNIAGLMGAFGAALFAKELSKETSSMLSLEELKTFSHDAEPLVCRGCTNRCNLTVNTFAGKRKFISGNRCEKPLGIKNTVKLPDIYDYKLTRIDEMRKSKNETARRGSIGIPMGLNMYENIFFWHEFFTVLGFNVVISDVSSRKLYSSAQQTIPSDTACYPAKLMHGHVQNLLDKGIRTIFYPCMTYNFDEGVGDNHFNCPVVAYYPELLRANMAALSDAVFLYPYFDVNHKKDFVKKAFEYFKGYYSDITKDEIKKATENAFRKYEQSKLDVMEEGKKAIQFARENGRRMIVLAGRPYHVDPEINHGMNKLITGLGLCVLSEDAVSGLVKKSQSVNVLNQWTYHQRLYDSAKFVKGQPDMELVQLVSFGCGIDAITTDEVNDILTRGGKLYTQLKIDEINNLGAVKIRLRSLLGAVEERESDSK